jgi:hypothetical protein
VTRASPLLLLGLVFCAPRKTIDPTVDSGVQSAIPPVITLERTPCFGGCPVYTLSVSPTGDVTYQGKKHVRQSGAASGKISQQQLDALIAELESAGYFSFADRYVSSEPACGRYATDLPTVITSVRLGERAKRIEHDYGCESAPGGLVVLERRIDEVLGSSRWTGR